MPLFVCQNKHLLHIYYFGNNLFYYLFFMKKIFIFCSVLITLSLLFLPFINWTRLLDIAFLANKSWLEIKIVAKALLMFLMWSWFLSIWYSKKLKISILWIIWILIYWYFYYKIFYVLIADYSNLIKSYNYSTYVIWERGTVEIIYAAMQKFSNHLSIWFYTLTIWFIINSFAMINILKNLIKSYKNINQVLLQTNEENIRKESWIRRIYTKE